MGLLEHLVIAVIVQFVMARLTGSWWLGAALASAYFLGREIAQAEYRWIELYGGGLRSNMPWWGPLDLRVWTTLDQWLDWIGPLVATVLIAWTRGRRTAAD